VVEEGQDRWKTKDYPSDIYLRSYNVHFNVKNMPIMTGYRFNDRGSIPGRDGSFLSSRSSKSRDSSQWVPRGLSQWVTQPKREANHSPSSHVDDKNKCIFTIILTLCLHTAALIIIIII
jgi:hypothetical protein